MSSRLRYTTLLLVLLAGNPGLAGGDRGHFCKLHSFTHFDVLVFLPRDCLCKAIWQRHTQERGVVYGQLEPQNFLGCDITEMICFPESLCFL